MIIIQCLLKYMIVNSIHNKIISKSVKFEVVKTLPSDFELKV